MTSIQVARRNLLEFAILVVASEGSEGSNRRRVYSFVSQWPGLHQREIARRLDLSPQNAAHHLRHLVRAGLLVTRSESKFVRYFVRVQGRSAPVGSVGRDEADKLGALRKARPLEIVAHLLGEPRIQMGALAAAMRLSPGTLTFHVKQLEGVGIVRRVQEGRERFVVLVDREHTIELLLAYEPPTDLVAGFQDIWDDIGF